jgi:hypothetical protein
MANRKSLNGILLAAMSAVWLMSASAWAADAPTSQPTAAAAPCVEPPAKSASDSPAVKDALDELKNPTPWFKWGFDQRVRWEWFKNCTTLNSDSRGSEESYQRYRSRLWGTISPTDKLEFNFRLSWEWRTYCTPEYKRYLDVDDYDAIFDTLNFKIKDLAGTGADLTVGRQDIVLGSHWLVRDGTPLDGSRTEFFDAVRLTAPLKSIDSTFDLIYIDQQARADKRIKPFNYSEYDANRYLMEQNERGAIAYFSNKSIERTTLDGYFIYKNDTPVLANGYDADTYTFGGRMERFFDAEERWKLDTEVAKQLGHRNGQDINALGGRAKLTYFFKDKLDNNLRMGYDYLSGDKGSTNGATEQFDLLWGRYPQYSECVLRNCIPETGRVGQVANMHRVFWGWGFKPTPKLDFCVDYSLIFADTNSYRDRAQITDSGCFKGQLVTAWLKYAITKNISGHVMGEVFCPGDYYSDLYNDVEVFLRAEVVFKL